MGNLYLADDILAAIHERRMSSLVVGDTWVVMQVISFPRAKVLELVVVVGDMEDFEPMHARILEFAATIGADLIQGYGRDGWLKELTKRGWKVRSRSFIYEKDL